MQEHLSVRRDLVRSHVLPKVREPVRECPTLDGSLPDLIDAVRAHGLEGLVAKRLDSVYESGQRSGAWRKMRINKEQEFVIGGYTPGARNFDALIFGCYQDGRLLYVARTRNGFTPASREQLYRRFQGLESSQCPFVNLPGARSRPLGPGPHRREDAGVPLAQACVGGAISVFGADARSPPAPRPVRRAQGRSEPGRRAPGDLGRRQANPTVHGPLTQHPHIGDCEPGRDL